MGILGTVYKWLFKRLPVKFSILFVLIATAYYIFLFPWLAYHAGPWVAAKLLRGYDIGDVLRWISPIQILSAFFTIGFTLVGLVLAYSLAAWAYGLLRSKRPRGLGVAKPIAPQVNTPSNASLDRYLKIGIILAGGGAKGAYQAGALKAIYEFISDQGALNRVKMIAGTSIGSWNALFWLADAMRNVRPCNIEAWWSAIDVPNIIQPWPYLPAKQNFFLSTDPWKELFDSMFGEGTEAGKHLLRHITTPDDEDSVHFYLTRSNVGRARLEFTTNNHHIAGVSPNMRAARPRPPVEPGSYDVASTIQDVKFAVFGSMDLPPLFRYAQQGDQYFEDGGVVDNLPIRFGTEIEKCDLLFVLPLNSTFAQLVDQKSILARLFRVMDVRQGVLERNSFKMIYLYNELAALRSALIESDETLVRIARQHGIANLSPDYLDSAGSIRDAERRLSTEQQTSAKLADPTSRAVLRRNQPLQVFSICPAPELAINTAEFWKTKEAGQAFRLMYEATKLELGRFDFINPPPQVQMAMVSPFGDVSYFVDF